MLKIGERITEGIPTATLTLPLERRVKARFRAVLDDGRKVGLFLNRGPVLRDGALLRAEDGSIIAVAAADEPVSVVETDDALLLARACYHLGNRHVPLQILAGGLRYQHDTVLDQMLTGLGLQPRAASLPFEPEPGAYDSHGDHHSHHHTHDHEH